MVACQLYLPLSVCVARALERTSHPTLGPDVAQQVIHRCAVPATPARPQLFTLFRLLGVASVANLECGLVAPNIQVSFVYLLSLRLLC